MSGSSKGRQPHTIAYLRGVWWELLRRRRAPNCAPPEKIAPNCARGAQADAERPHVDALAEVAVAEEHLGRRVVRRAARHLEHLVRRAEDRAEPKVDELDVAVGVEEHVLGLEVAVDHVGAVARVDRRHELREELHRLGLLEAAVLHDVLEELAARHVLGDQVDRVDRLDHLEQVEHLRVLHTVQDGDLVHQPRPRVLVDDLVLLEDLHRHRLARVPLDREHHLAERAVADRLEQRVVAHCL